MEKKSVQEFFEFVKGDQALRDKLAQGCNAGELMALAAENGFEFTAAELREHIGGLPNGTGQLSDEQLASVAGGQFMVSLPTII